MAAFIHAKLRSKGIRLRLGHSVEGFRQEGDNVEVLLKMLLLSQQTWLSLQSV